MGPIGALLAVTARLVEHLREPLWRWRLVMGPIGALLALPAAASVQALVSIYLHRYEVIADPLTRTPYPARRAP